MSSHPRANLLLFEIAVIASLLGIGWALIHVYGTQADLARRPPPAMPRPEARQVARLTTLVALREHYQILGEQITADLRAIRTSLSNYEQDRSGAITHYQREADRLRQHLSESARMLTAAADRLPPGELTALLRLDPDSADAADLRPAPLLSHLAGAVSNHLARLNIGDATPLSPDIIQRKFTQAAGEEAKVIELAGDARMRAQHIDALLTRHAVDLVTPAAAPARADDLADQKAANEVALRLLAGVFLLLAIVLIVSIYRRAVVMPLHQRMIENTASAEYQRKLDHFARVATGLAHEIRNPLTAIGIRLFTLQKSLPPEGAQQADALLIRAEIDRLEQIVKNFLRLARPAEPRLARLTARPLLEDTRALLAEQCRAQGTDLRIDDVTATEFPGDAAQLKQILINLVQNAAESVSGPGQIVMRAYDTPDRVASPTGQREQSFVVLEVKDTGGGIAPEIQERLFDPFFSTKESGTGLGLPIAAKIADQHQGRMEFDSRPGEGATFRVILPTASQS